mgnify:CR=1 FL=1
MAIETWTLTDHANNTWADAWSLERGHWQVRKETLHAGLSSGVDLITIRNGDLSLQVLPTRGMNLWKGTFRDLPLGWQSPVKGPVHPAFIRPEEKGGTGWINGCDEWIPRCGLGWIGAPCTETTLDQFGNPKDRLYTLHGRISNCPAHHVQIELDSAEDTLTLTGVVDETAFRGEMLRLHSRLTLRSGEHRFTIRDRIENIGGSPHAYQILYHTNFGHPLLAEGATLEADFSRLDPRDESAQKGLDSALTYGRPIPGQAEQVYFAEVNPGPDRIQNVSLLNPQIGIKATLQAHADELPCFTLWKNENALPDGYVTGLEFGTGYPTNRTTEREAGRFRTLAPGQSDEVGLRVAIDPLD